MEVDVTWDDRVMTQEEPGDEPAVEYRKLSTRAVLSFVLGLLSPLAFAHSLLWSVPLLAVVFSLLSLRFLRRSEPVYSGRRWAMAGLVLGAICLAAAPADALMWRWIVVRQSKQFTQQWLQVLLDGDERRAHYWSLSHAARPRSESTYARYFREPRYQQRIEEYFERTPLDRMLGNSEVEVEWVRAGTIVGTVDDCYVAHHYRVRYPDRRGETIAVTAHRKWIADEGVTHWAISKVIIEHFH